MSKNKCNMVINKARLAKDHLHQVISTAQDVQFSLATEIEEIIFSLEAIIQKTRKLREESE